MKKLILSASAITLLAVACSDNGSSNHQDQDTSQAITKDEMQTQSIDETKGLIDCNSARNFVEELHNRIDPNQPDPTITINANDPIVWKIAPSDLLNLADSTDSAIAMLGVENGQLTLIIGKGINGQATINPDYVYETFKPLTTMMNMSTPADRDQFRNTMFKNCQ